MGLRIVRWVSIGGALLLAACSGAGGGEGDAGTGETRASSEAGGTADYELAESAPAPLAAAGESGAAEDAVDTTTSTLRATRKTAAKAEPAPVDVVVDAAAGLRAGSVDDNARFADYLDYRRRFLKTGIPVHDRDVSERHVVRVVGADGNPVLGAEVALLRGAAPLQVVRTQADGRALLHPLVTDLRVDEPFTIDVVRGAATGEREVEDRAVRNHEIVLDGVAPAGVTRLDVHFLIDATGSMDDEIDRLKQTMARVAARITALPARPDVRWGLTAYRDRGEAFVTRTSDFTTDLGSFTRQLAKVEALDGGDDPEALNEALHAAVHKPSWDSDNAVQIIFLIADAAPHLDYKNDEDYAVDMFEAARRGIAVVPISSSGMDDQGEYVFRQLAQVTLGRFMFLTYGANGEPGDGTTRDVEGYEVQSLDEMVVRYVAEQLAHREPREDQQ